MIEQYVHTYQRRFYICVQFQNLWDTSNPWIETEILYIHVDVVKTFPKRVAYTWKGDFMKQNHGKEPKSNIGSGFPLRQRPTCRTFRCSVPRSDLPHLRQERAIGLRNVTRAYLAHRDMSGGHKWRPPLCVLLTPCWIILFRLTPRST